jgi:protein tyrosine phosphatase
LNKINCRWQFFLKSDSYSNGAGRTGAYILLDLVLGRMNKGAREIDIAATLEHLRDQRAGLVATRQQFEFVLMAVAEEVRTASLVLFIK